MVNKLTNTVQPLDEINKINELVDELNNSVKKTDIATTSELGIVKPDNSSILINSSGVLSTNCANYPKTYHSLGLIANCDGGTAEGSGTAFVVLYANGLAKIEFSYRIITAGTTTLFSQGINRDLLKHNNNALPVITPMSGGVLQYVNASGNIDFTLQNYGGLFQANNQFWLPARVYSSQSAVGGYPENMMTLDLGLSGVAYGTYIVGTEG